jgi:hypothetical protein
MLMMRVLNRADANSATCEFFDQLNNQPRFSMVLATNNMQSIHDATYLKRQRSPSVDTIAVRVYPRVTCPATDNLNQLKRTLAKLCPWRAVLEAI